MPAAKPQDYANVGAEIADTAVKIEGTASSSGLSQDAIQSIVDGYTTKRVQLAATNCSPSATPTSPTPAQPTTSTADEGASTHSTTDDNASEQD